MGEPHAPFPPSPRVALTIWGASMPAKPPPGHCCHTARSLPPGSDAARGLSMAAPPSATVSMELPPAITRRAEVPSRRSSQTTAGSACPATAVKEGPSPAWRPRLSSRISIVPSSSRRAIETLNSVCADRLRHSSSVTPRRRDQVRSGAVRSSGSSSMQLAHATQREPSFHPRSPAHPPGNSTGPPSHVPYSRCAVTSVPKASLPLCDVALDSAQYHKREPFADG